MVGKIVLIDDKRVFKDETNSRDVIILRSSKEALQWLNGLGQDTVVDELWLDFDLGVDDNWNSDTIMPFVAKLTTLAKTSEAPTIRKAIVHTAGSVGANFIMEQLSPYFNVVRENHAEHLRIGGTFQQ